MANTLAKRVTFSELINGETYKRAISNVISIKQGELKSWNPLTEEIEVDLILDDFQREKLPTIGYVAMFEYLNGFRKTIYWSREKMENHALRYSKGYAARKNYTMWEKDFDAMAYKTMLRQIISKWGVMSIELQTAFSGDNAVIGNDLSPLDNVDETPILEPVQDGTVAESEEPGTAKSDKQMGLDDL